MSNIKLCQFVNFSEEICSNNKSRNNFKNWCLVFGGNPLLKNLYYKTRLVYKNLSL